MNASGNTGASALSDGLQSLSFDVTANHVTTTGYEYDAMGNQTKVKRADGSIQQLQYDAAGRLANVKDANNTTIATNTYGASNERLISQEGSYRTYYAWSGGATTVEYSEVDPSTSLQWTKSYIYLGNRLLATIEPAGNSEFVSYQHPDRLGTRLITNNQNSSVIEQVHLPFGNALDAESTGATKRRFTSYERSATTGLDYAVNRHYDPLQGRFTTVDPIGAGASSFSDPQSWNLYAYCGNDPINHTDPNGLFWGKLFGWISKALKWVAVAAAVAAAILTVFGAPLAGTLLGSILGFIAGVPSAIGSFVAGVGNAVAGVFGFAEAGTSALIAGLIGNGVLIGGSVAAGAVADHLQKRRKIDSKKKRKR